MSRKLLEKLFTMFYRKHLLRPKILINYVTMISWRSPNSWKRFIANISVFMRFALTKQAHLGEEVKKVSPITRHKSG